MNRRCTSVLRELPARTERSAWASGSRRHRSLQRVGDSSGPGRGQGSPQPWTAACHSRGEPGEPAIRLRVSALTNYVHWVRKAGGATGPTARPGGATRRRWFCPTSRGPRSPENKICGCGRSAALSVPETQVIGPQVQTLTGDDLRPGTCCQTRHREVDRSTPDQVGQLAEFDPRYLVNLCQVRR